MYVAYKAVGLSIGSRSKVLGIKCTYSITFHEGKFDPHFHHQR